MASAARASTFRAHEAILLLFEDLRLGAPIHPHQARVFGGTFKGMGIFRGDTPVTIQEMIAKFTEAEKIHKSHASSLVNCIWNFVRDTGVSRHCPGCGCSIPWSEVHGRTIQHAWCYACNGKGRKVTKKFKKEKAMFKQQQKELLEHQQQNMKEFAKAVYVQVNKIAELTAIEAIIDGIEKLVPIWNQINYLRQCAHYNTTVLGNLNPMHNKTTSSYAELICTGHADRIKEAFPAFMLEML